MKRSMGLCSAVIIAGLLGAGFLPGFFVPPVSAAAKNACSAEIAQFCPNVKPDAAAIMSCLEEHENELSEACKKYEATMMGTKVEKWEKAQDIRTFRRVCMEDIVKFCSDADPAKSGLLRCLGAHDQEISEPCRGWLKADAARNKAPR